MYNHIAEDMVDAKVAILFATPRWMDKAGNVVKEEQVFGCQITHDITNPDYCLVMDEVGGNMIRKAMEIWAVSCNYAK